MIRKKLLILLIPFIVYSSLLSQTNQFSTPDLIRSEGIDLGGRQITDITEDWNGLIWIATTDGLFKYDGTKAEIFTNHGVNNILLDNHINDILIDFDKKLIWVATRYGLTKMDPVLQKVNHYFSDPQIRKSLADDYVLGMTHDNQGNLWVNCYANGLCKYDSESDDFDCYKYDVKQIDSLMSIDPSYNEGAFNSFVTVTSDLEGDNIWLGTYIGLFRFSLSTYQFKWEYLTRSLPEHELLKEYVFDIKPIDHRIAVATADGAYIYDPTSQSIERIVSDHLDSNELGLVMNLNKEDSLISVSFQNGALNFNTNKNETTETNLNQPSINNFYNPIFIDSKGRSWFYRFGQLTNTNTARRQEQIYVDPEMIHLKPVVTKNISDSEIFILNNDPRYYQTLNYADGTINTYRFHLTNQNWNTIKWKDISVINKGQILLLDDNSVFDFDLSTGSLHKLPWNFRTKGPRLEKIITDSHDNVWIGSIDVGLHRFNLNSDKHDHYTSVLNDENQSAQHTWIKELFCDSKNRVWIRLARSFAIYFPDEKVFKLFPWEKNKTNTFQYVTAFEEDQNGDIWIAGENQGIGRVDGSNPKAGIVKKIDLGSPLVGKTIFDLARGADSTIWILSELGLSFFNVGSSKMSNIIWQSGDLVPNSILPLDQGAIGWGLNNGGFCILDPLAITENKSVPIPYVTKLLAGEKEIFNAGNQLNFNNIQLHSDRDYLTFEFSGLGYSNPKQFAYKLVDIDDNWTYTNDTKSTSYTNLSPGSYNFFVKSRVVGEKWSDEQSITVEIIPRWWETLWFKILVAFALILSLVTGFRIRMSSIRKSERLKSEFNQRLQQIEMDALRSQMNPHFLFNSLNSIQHFIIKNKQKEAVEYLNRFSRLIRLILQNSRSKYVTLRDEFEALNIYVELENIRFNNHFEYRKIIDSSIDLDNVEIPPMILQPFIENAIWHGLLHKKEKGILTISINQVANDLVCVVEDNGVGRKAASAFKNNSTLKRKSMGMTITKNRLDIINSQSEGKAGFVIEDLLDDQGLGRGTKVTVSIPI